MADFDSYSNHFLIAMPGLAGSYFEGTLIYLVRHDPKGAWGLVVNHPTELALASVLNRLTIPLASTPELHDCVYIGGPVASDRGCVLHGPLEGFQATTQVSPEIGCTLSRDLLEMIAKGRGPADRMFFLGSAGWGAGQLESELAEGAWLTMPADTELLFHVPAERRYSAALGKLGVSVDQLRAMQQEAGHA